MNYLDALQYCSKTFSIVTERVAGNNLSEHVLAVFDEQAGLLVEQVVCEHHEEAYHEFERLKTKYIFDYEQKLAANKACF